MNARKVIVLLFITCAAFLLIQCGGAPPLSLLVTTSTTAPEFKPNILEMYIAPQRRWGILDSWSDVRITLQSYSSNQQHRLVVIDGSQTDVASVVAEAATTADFKPPASPNVLAYTSLVGPKSWTEIVFTPPGPGQYYYVCTVPGHYQAGMWGTLTLYRRW